MDAKACLSLVNLNTLYSLPPKVVKDRFGRVRVGILGEALFLGGA